MVTAPTAIIDACVLYSAPIRDLVVRLAQAGLLQARWSDEIHEEWMRNLLKNNPTVSRERLERTRFLMDAAIRDSIGVGTVSAWGRCQTLFLVLTCCLRNQKQSLSPDERELLSRRPYRFKRGSRASRELLRSDHRVEPQRLASEKERTGRLQWLLERRGL
jgi:hypothetical protein